MTKNSPGIKLGGIHTARSQERACICLKVIDVSITTVNGNIIPEGYIVQLPNNVGNLVAFTNPNAGDFEASAGIFFSPLREAQLEILVAYLGQIWSRTAGRVNPSAVDTNTLVVPSSTITFPGNEFRRIRFDLTASVLGGRGYGGTIRTGYYGVYQWQYGSSSGPLHYISFPSQVMEPDWDGASGISYTLAPHVTGTYSALGVTTPLPGLIMPSQNSCNPSTNDFSGPTHSGAGQGWQFNGFGFVDTQKLAALVSGNILDNSTTKQFIYQNDTLSLTPTAGWYALAQAYVNEIWTYCCARNNGTSNTGAMAISTAKIYSAGGLFVRAANMTASIVSPNSEQVFGTTGLPYLGVWAESVNGAMGELRYINSMSSYLVPRFWDCDGVFVAIKAGVSASINLVTIPSLVLASDTGNGPVNLAGGQNTGLLYT